MDSEIKDALETLAKTFKACMDYDDDKRAELKMESSKFKGGCISQGRGIHDPKRVENYEPKP